MSAYYNEAIASKLFTYFAERQGMIENNKGWLVGDCPHCGKKKKFGVSVESNRSNCFVCGTKTSPLYLVKDIEGFNTIHEVYALLENYSSFKLNIRTHDTKPKYVKQENTHDILPKEFKLVGLREGTIENMVRKALKKRGFSVSKAMSKGIGYCADGPYKYRWIIPWYTKGKVVYFNARALLSMGSKYKNPEEDEIGIGKSQVIYNHDALYTYNKIWIFEGAINAITIGDNATATGGKEVSRWQKSEYVKSTCNKVVIALDSDAYLEGIKLALILASSKKVKVLKFPEGKDANDLGRKATKEIEKNTPYLSYNELYKLYLNEKNTQYSY